MGFAERKAIGDQLETRIADELIVRGWHVNEWGQGVLDEATRAALRRSDTPFRYTPDMVATRGEQVVLIDCKARATSHQTGRHAIEKKSVSAHRVMHSWFDLPVYYVFEDHTVLTPEQVIQLGRPGQHSTVGSGAPYFLIGTGHSVPLDDVFGPPEAMVLPLHTRGARFDELAV